MRIESDVRVRHVGKVEDLGEPDVVILPGSKNVVTDLQYLQRSGFAARILDLVKRNQAVLVGICGGYQMLGRSLIDPHGIETQYPVFEGLGLLDIETTLEENKRLMQTRGKHLTSSSAVVGYEIHHGVTRVVGPVPVAFISDTGEALGHRTEDERVWGTYLHGVFDSDEFRREFLNSIRLRKGLTAISTTARYNLEVGIDKLAQHVRGSLDMKAIYEELGL